MARSMMNTENKTVTGEGNAPRVEIKIGTDEAVRYHVRQTRAPKAYDGFGTIELADYNDYGRIVLIRDEHLAWQEGRYSSGTFACTSPEYYDEKSVCKELWNRIAHAEGRVE
jgi:hypothetical protein